MAPLSLVPNLVTISRVYWGFLTLHFLRLALHLLGTPFQASLNTRVASIPNLNRHWDFLALFTFDLCCPCTVPAWTPLVRSGPPLAVALPLPTYHPPLGHGEEEEGEEEEEERERGHLHLLVWACQAENWEKWNTIHTCRSRHPDSAAWYNYRMSNDKLNIAKLKVVLFICFTQVDI